MILFFWLAISLGVLLIAGSMVLSIVWNTPMLAQELSGKAKARRVSEMVKADRQFRNTTNVGHYNNSGVLASGPVSILPEEDDLDMPTDVSAAFTPRIAPVVEAQLSGTRGYVQLDSRESVTGYMEDLEGAGKSEINLDYFSTGYADEVNSDVTTDGHQPEILASEMKTGHLPFLDHAETPTGFMDDASTEPSSPGVEAVTGFMDEDNAESPTGFMDDADAKPNTSTAESVTGFMDDEDVTPAVVTEATTGFMDVEGDAEAPTGMLDEPATGLLDSPAGRHAAPTSGVVETEATTGFLDEDRPASIPHFSPEASTGFMGSPDDLDNESPTGYIGRSDSVTGIISEDDLLGADDRAGGTLNKGNAVRVLESVHSWSVDTNEEDL